MGLFGSKPRQARTSSPLRVKDGKNKLRSLTASGERITEKGAEEMRRLNQPWQERSFLYYDALGEIKYAAQFYSRMLAPLRLYAAEIGDDGEIKETDNAEAKDALARIQDPGGGRTVMLAAYGRLMFLTGEATLFVSTDKATEEERWEMLSSKELRNQGGGYQRYRAPSLGAEEYRMPSDDDWETVDDKEATAYRLWQRHPQYSALADSTMMGVLDLCEELLILTKAVRARARSRSAGSGILWLDETASPGPPDASPDEDPEEDVLVVDVTEAMTTPIADEGAASAVVPIVVRIPVPEGRKIQDLVYHMQLVDPTQLYPETGLRYECIKRIALGLDMPPEHLLGLGDSNHWSAWQIDEQTWKAHGQPKAQQFVDDMTAAYFRPYLRKKIGAEEAARFVIAYDPAAVINHPDRSRDAKDLHTARAISKAALREAAGFTDEDEMPEEELAEAIGVAVGDARLALTGVIADPKPDPVPPMPPEPPQEPVEAPESGSDVESGPPPPTDNGDGREAVRAAIEASRLIGCSDMALLRAREVAGSRLRSLARGDSELAEALDGIPNGAVASILGRERVRALKAPPERALVAGVKPLIADTVRAWGIADERVVKGIVEAVEQHAARTLYDLSPKMLPDSFATYLTGLSTNGS